MIGAPAFRFLDGKRTTEGLRRRRPVKGLADTPGRSFARRKKRPMRLVQGRPSRRKRPVSDPTLAEVIRGERGTKGAIRTWLVATAAAADAKAKAGLLVARYLEADDAPADFSAIVRDRLGLSLPHNELVFLGAETQVRLRREARERFGNATVVRFRWLPHIAA